MKHTILKRAVIRLLIATLMLGSFVFVFDKPQEVSAAVPTITVYMGQKPTIASLGLNDGLNWKSSKTKVLQVKNKKLVGKKTGKAYITASYGGQVYKYLVVVKKSAYVLNSSSLSVRMGASTRITGTFYGKMSHKLKYSSNNKKIATVTKSGVVVGKKVGTTKIKVTTADKKSRYCTIHVTTPYPISLSSGAMNISVGESQYLPLTTNAYNAYYTFTSNNPGVVTVNNSGVVTAVSKGSAVIIIQSPYESKYVNVTSYSAVSINNMNFIAHRGYHVSCLENTMAAFTSALNNGFVGVETDVYMTKDGQFVLSHDGNLNTVWGVNKDISSYTFDELNSSLASFAPDQRLAKLTDLLSLVKSTGKFAVLELKSSAFTDAQLKEFHSLLEEYGVADKVYVSSFYWDYLVKLRSMDSNIKLQFTSSGCSVLSYGNINVTNPKHKTAWGDYVSSVTADDLVYYNIGLDWWAYYALQHPEFISTLNQKGVRLVVWTIDNKYTAGNAYDMGIRNVMTDQKYF